MKSILVLYRYVANANVSYIWYYNVDMYIRGLLHNMQSTLNFTEISSFSKGRSNNISPSNDKLQVTQNSEIFSTAWNKWWWGP